jgi:hypothetical protein
MISIQTFKRLVNNTKAFGDKLSSFETICNKYKSKLTNNKSFLLSLMKYLVIFEYNYQTSKLN